MGEEQEQSDGLLTVVRRIAISPQGAKALVLRLRERSEREQPNASAEEHQERVARAIVTRYCRFAAMTGGATALTGVIPGIGTALAAVGGSAADIAVSMKLQVDMCFCIAEAFGYDVIEPDVQQLGFLIAAGGAAERFGVGGSVKIASKAGVKLLRQYLKGAALQVVKELFKKLGITFTRKALEKALPFGIGVAFGAGGNYAMTKYIGNQAVRWFVIDRDERSEPAPVAV